MKITVNGKPHTVTPNISLLQLLEELSFIQHSGLAIAKNHTLITKGQWASTLIEEGDELEILQASAGG